MQRSVTQKVQSISSEIDWCKKLEKYRNMFNKSDRVQKELLDSHKSKVLRKDEELAKLVSTEAVLVCVFRNLIEVYNYCEYVRVRDSEKPKKNSIEQLKEDKEKKEILLEQECGCMDYGTLKKQTRKMQ